MLRGGAGERAASMLRCGLKVMGDADAPCDDVCDDVMRYRAPRLATGRGGTGGIGGDCGNGSIVKQRCPSVPHGCAGGCGGSGDAVMAMTGASGWCVWVVPDNKKRRSEDPGGAWCSFSGSGSV